MEKSSLITELIKNIKYNFKNANTEIKNHTLNFLQTYEYDNLLELIKLATKKGYSGIEWIDFWGIGGLDSDIIIQWAYKVIKKQNLYEIIEPYYNNINYRLGISLKRKYITGKLLFLPMELQNTKNNVIDSHFSKIENGNQCNKK